MAAFVGVVVGQPYATVVNEKVVAVAVSCECDAVLQYILGNGEVVGEMLAHPLGVGDNLV